MMQHPGACAGFLTGGARRCGPNSRLYTDREDVEAFILSKTGGEQGGGVGDARPPLDTCLTSDWICGGSW